MTRFTGKRAFVSGASGGIGRAVVAQMVAEGATVAGLDRDVAGMKMIEAAHPRRFFGIMADLADVEAAREGVHSAVIALGGAPDMVVNAAGVYALAPALDVELPDWEFNQSINLRASFFVSQAAVQARRDAGTNAPMSIVHVSSTGAVRMGTGDAALSYGASKAGLIGLTVGMAADWAKIGVRVNVVVPGVIDTSMVRLMDDPDVGRAWLQARVPLNRLGRPEEVAKAICFLASEDASYITGTQLVVDGGYLCV
ncbi:SDR family oxidoreductase [Mesorhizobium sp. RP14(2022)]|uniref:SDR family oxidoreductase n=1 Tax=Mesorhizobium liriopis TaxID=2953882 RepID=A0ABT1C329_9HYPH|nr:SDR family oxidoreductase [Mesorhizobium liriopis]MCO6049234.1 SDR family oxidoreductase [Mesorhizobium liriopis]